MVENHTASGVGAEFISALDNAARRCCHRTVSVFGFIYRNNLTGRMQRWVTVPLIFGIIGGKSGWTAAYRRNDVRWGHCLSIKRFYELAQCTMMSRISSLGLPALVSNE